MACLKNQEPLTGLYNSDCRNNGKSKKGRGKMIEDITDYLDKLDEQTKQRFYALQDLVYQSTSEVIDKKLWAKLPSFYVGHNFVRIIPFKDHINIEAKAVLAHKDELCSYKLTPKGMLQIYHNQQIPNEMLKRLFKESLERVV